MATATATRESCLTHPYTERHGHAVHPLSSAEAPLVPVALPAPILVDLVIVGVVTGAILGVDVSRLVLATSDGAAPRRR